MATITPKASLSTAAVKPQNRIFDSDKEKQIVLLNSSVADHALVWAPGRRIKIIGIRGANGAVAMGDDTNSVAIDIDIYDNSATAGKAHDVAAKAADVAVAANKWFDFTLSATAADTVVEATESVRVLWTVVGTQGSSTVTISYVELTVGQMNVDFTA